MSPVALLVVCLLIIVCAPVWLTRPATLGVALLAIAPWLSLAGVIWPSMMRPLQGGYDVAILVVGCSAVLTLARSRDVRLSHQSRPVPFSLAFYFSVCLLVLVGMGNSHVPNLSVGLVGVRAWILYPLCIPIGILIVRSGNLTALYRRVVLVGFPAIALGLIDSIRATTGQPGVVATYFPGSTVAREDFGGFVVGAGRIDRITSVFPFPLAYFAFTLFFMTAATGLYLVSRTPLRLAILLAAALACASSGTRLSLLVIPIFMYMGLRADKGSTRIGAMIIIPLVGATYLSTSGISITHLAPYLLDLAVMEWGDVVVSGMSQAVSVTTWGFGPGTDTAAARDLVEGNLFQQIGGRWQESLLAKSWIELGVVGFTLVCVIWASIAGAAVRALKAAPRLVSPLAALVLTVLVVSLKGSVTDQASTAVYFWFAVGGIIAFSRITSFTSGTSGDVPAVHARQ